MRLREGEFKSWLKAKPPTEIVGENRDCHSCPIANFYLEVSGGCEIVIFDRGDDYFIDRGYDKRRLPLWAAHFVANVDEDAYGQISAGRALEILTVR